jgi:hypothetical protein
MIKKIGEWRWGPNNKLGIGAACGIVMVIAMVILIALDLTQVTRQVQPPPFLSDWKPEQQPVCTSFKLDLEQIEKSQVKFKEYGWAEWPTPTKAKCLNEDEAAPDGEVRWHSCTTMRKDPMTSMLKPSCPLSEDGKPRKGYTWTRIRNGKIVAADIYINEDLADKCTVAHELAHARGFISINEDDNRHIDGAHTEKPNHLLSENCGDSWQWLDRTEGGDWPY